MIVGEDVKLFLLESRSASHYYESIYKLSNHEEKLVKLL